MKLPLLLLAFSLVINATQAITLDAALQRTIENNPQIRQAKAQLEAAAGRRLLFRARTLPDARTNLPIGVQGGHRSGQKSVQPFAFDNFAIAQPFFDMAFFSSRRRGEIEVLLAQQRLNIAVLEQLHTARIAFYTAAYNTSLEVVGEEQRHRVEANFKTQSERLEAGQSDRAAVASARTLQGELPPRLEEMRRTRNGALLQLAQCMGENLATEFLPSAEGELQFGAADFDIEAETQATLERRPDLKLARLLVRAAAEDQRIIAAQYYPAIVATVSGTYIPVSDIHRGSAGTARPSDDIVSSELRTGGAYTWRVIDNGEVGGAVLRQKSIKEINELVVQRLEDNVPRELVRIHNDLAALRAKHNALTSATTNAEKTVADVQNNLAEGLSSQLEYRTAESSFLETKASLLSVIFQQNIERAEYDRVTGRYFQFSDEPGKVH
ncbi:MAG: TolC family protein [Chthoniobacterales bacterium]